MHALAKFRQYLVGNKFVVKTNHNSLRHFLTQKDLNERKRKWVSKIQAYDFDIEYVKGKNNIVVDALSLRPSFSLMDMAKNWKDMLLVEYAKDKFACDVLDGLMGDDKYIIFYVKGKNNIVADALSRKPSFSLMAIAKNWKDMLLVEYAKDKFACDVLDGLMGDDN